MWVKWVCNPPVLGGGGGGAMLKMRQKRIGYPKPVSEPTCGRRGYKHLAFSKVPNHKLGREKMLHGKAGSKAQM